LLQTASFSQFQAVNPPSQSLSTMTRAKQDIVWVKVAEAVEDALRRQF
jgi:hypothetical protein